MKRPSLPVRATETAAILHAILHAILESIRVVIQIGMPDSSFGRPWGHPLRIGVGLACAAVLACLQPFCQQVHGEIVVDARSVIQGDSLLLDVRVDSLFNRRALDAISSGMTTSIAYRLRLEHRDEPVDERAYLIRLNHDIWEGRYLILRGADAEDTVTVTSFEDVIRETGTLPTWTLSPPPGEPGEYVLRIRADVNPISPEQRERTRRWLNLLERGSLLELFIDLNPGEAESGWVEALRIELPRDDAAGREAPE